MKQTFLALFATLLTLPVQAQAGSWREFKRFEFERTPHYFFRAFSDRPLITYNSFSNNYLLNTDTGEEWDLPFWVDPVPTPDDGKILAIPPFYGHEHTGGMSFFLTQALMEGKSAYDAGIHQDFHLPGSYQTMGILHQTAEETHLRIVAESVVNKTTGFYLQEYRVRNLEEGRVSMHPVYHEIKRVCPDVSFTLPMLSKTGRFLGGADPKTSETKIMKIEEDGSCHVVRNLGMSTGKLDFNYDDSEVAFHVDTVDPSTPVTRVTRLVLTPSRNLHLNVMTYNLETNKFKQLTSCVNANCYYPGYKRNGDIIYLEQNHGTGKYNLVHLKKNKKVIKYNDHSPEAPHSQEDTYQEAQLVP